MKETPNSERLRIVLAGERNSGKSSLMNALAGQEISIVSDTAGTTTDHVAKAIEIIGLGPCLLVDTAGLGDSGELGEKRVGKTLDELRSADIVLAVVDAASGNIPALPAVSCPVIPVLSRCDLVAGENLDRLSAKIADGFGSKPVRASAIKGEGISEIISAISEAVPEDWNAPLLTAGMVDEGDLVVLVMPQDREAPKGRLILPQQQTIRELLERGCRVCCCVPETLEATLGSLSEAPAAIITDSQAFAAVKPLTPAGTRLTSFSILLAASKGDIGYFKESARTIDRLTASSRILIAEACAHVPASEDIGRVKIPRLLRKKAGEGLTIDFVAGRDFPGDLSPYDLIIHCGACMFNRRYVLSRVSQAKEQGVPMTNYGVAIAYINNII